MYDLSSSIWIVSEELPGKTHSFFMVIVHYSYFNKRILMANFAIVPNFISLFSPALQVSDQQKSLLEK